MRVRARLVAVVAVAVITIAQLQDFAHLFQ
jgi:hypothetical protein